MFVVDLAVLRDGEVRLERRIEPDDPLLEPAAEAYRSPVDLDLTARWAGDAVWVEARARTVLALQCRRCLGDVEHPVDARFDLVYQVDADPEDGEVYSLDAHLGRLDLSAGVREHLLLQVPQYATCSAACRGFCAQCGVNLNVAQCDCEPETGGSPWDALRDIRFDS